ncbi:hypothetical protein PPERSA_04891 [Pseudocohnilembus persalinus]|uniref:Uncharacterized protein n=1 Tax=Pseudocohnilembus persalinus TaxID=266149 RepID=A0A0V0QJ41_PSEPJ|nr:hypothetical protein PPERSA_04891 [Pseudocohnilembus persalinus]|eukprot:KRX02269.1 hypothetical protein PPERSA_04891 [Pseudocohnilembus persalinus]
MKSHNVQDLNTFENTYSQSQFKDLEQTLQLQFDQNQQQNQNAPLYYSRINTPMSQQGIRKRIRKTSNQLNQQQEEFQEEFLDQWKNKNGKFLFGGLQLENKNIKQEVEELITDKKEMNKLKKLKKNSIQSKQQTRFNSQEKNEKQQIQLKESKSQQFFNPLDSQKNDLKNNNQNDIFCNEKSQWVV